METIDKRKFEKSEAIKVRIRKAGGKIEDVDATFEGPVKGENRAWVSIAGKKYRKSMQSIFKIDGKYIAPHEYYGKATKKANKKAAAVTAKENKKSTAKKDHPIMEMAKDAAAKPAAKKPKLDTSKEPKKLSKIDRVIIALAKNPEYEMEAAIVDIECTPSCFKQVQRIVSSKDLKITAEALKWELSRVEKVAAKFKAAQ